MRIAALTLNGARGWPALELSHVAPGLNAIYGPAGSGKSTVADFLAHALYGQTAAAGAPGTDARIAPDGEAVVESCDGRYRLRRYSHGNAGSRLTVSALDGSGVNHETVRRMLGGLSPVVLRRLCAISFRQPPNIQSLLSPEFAREFQAIGFGAPPESRRRTAELLARRDTLAKELETRLAGEGRASRDLDTRRRELDRIIVDSEREAATVEQRFRNVEAALTETDTRLRYRRLEMNVDRTWQTSEPANWDQRLSEFDEQITRWRAVLAELASREAVVRARLSQPQSPDGAVAATVIDQRAWMVVARQLAADLSGEVARLARASASEQCVCRDAHPRLRPVVETIQRQLEVLNTLVHEHEQALAAAELHAEVGHLVRSQAELGRQLEHLLERRQSLARGASPRRRSFGLEPLAAAALTSTEGGDTSVSFTAADAEQLERRRHELEEERFELVNRLAAEDRRLRDLRAQRATVDRQRAALLSARSIEHVQRELAAVQQKLQQSATSDGADGVAALSADNSPRASDILAKLTDGRLVKLQLVDQGRSVNVWTRDGVVVAMESLSPPERDQVYLSFSLALVSAAERQAVQLPLLLDEPFLRLDAGGISALAAVLDDLGRHGQQILVFTGQTEAAQRLTSLAAPLQDIQTLRLQHRDDASVVPSLTSTPTTVVPPANKKPQSLKRKVDGKKRPKRRSIDKVSDNPASADQSDAA